MKEYQI